MLRLIGQTYSRLVKIATQTISKGKFFLSTYVISYLIYAFLINNQLVNSLDGLWCGQYRLSGFWDIQTGRMANVFIDALRLGVNGEPLQSLIALFFYQ